MPKKLTQKKPKLLRLCLIKVGDLLVKIGLRLVPWVLGYQCFRAIGWPKLMPINVTVSITNMCNSRCKTCYIWELYKKQPSLKEKEMTTEEFVKTFEALDKTVVWYTMSGGEPFLRPDIAEICEAACEINHPEIINIPSNGLLPQVIETKTKQILERCDETTLIVNLSLDGVDQSQDEIRGIPGNFKLLLETYNRLNKLKEEFPHFQLGIHSVISKFSINNILDVYEYAKQLNPDSYITEVAEERAELHTIGKEITPSFEEYGPAIDELSSRIRNDYLQSQKAISRATQAFRLAYYQIAAQVLREKRQIVNCYAGYISCQITPYGDVWLCCILGQNKPLGNLREVNYDFKKIWFSKGAEEARRFVKSKQCYCPLANAHYTNILCSPKAMFKVLRNMVFVR
jgi:MoaA/NifB/PqqE/SkfB family radical SAM enzyme